MAQDFSFDVVSEVNLQSVDDAVNTAMREITTRFDLKGTAANIEFNKTDKTITVNAASEFQLKQVKAILSDKLAARGISVKALSVKSTDVAISGSIRELNTIVCGIEKEMAKTIVKDIKGLGVKVQSAIQDEKIRVSSRDKDSLQKVIAFLKAKTYEVPLQFNNYR